jgi:hypothetical protein
MIFYRILDNKVYSSYETDKLGFSTNDISYVPDEYLENREFIVMRTCHGVGDWGILSAMPRLLKEKYPDCKVYVPSHRLLKKMFGEPTSWNWWSNPYKNVNVIFDNNPYVDDFVDNISGDIFHDHYRIYDDDNTDIPLVNQMLKFWQFTEDEMEDSQPELYWSDKEIELGDAIIKECVGEREFGGLMVTNTYPFDRDDLVIKVLEDNPVPYFYYTPVSLEETSFNFIERALDLRHVDIRIQLYIRSKAKLNVVAHQNGLTQTVARYSNNYELQRDFPIGSNFIRGETYLRDDFKRNLLSGAVKKSVSKTTTSMKFKADTIDFFKNDFKDKTILEIGTSLGYGTKIFSGLFNKVITVDNSSAKMYEAKENLKHLDNIDFRLMDVYRDRWSFDEKVDVVFIDCVHTYEHLKSDIDNSLNTFDKPIIFFDDYGLYPDLKRLIDEYVNIGKFKILKKIGQHKGKIYPKTVNKILQDREGIICQVV